MKNDNFELLAEQFLAELDCNSRIYAHCRTGARLVSVEAADRNKVFGIQFRTPVSDSTGLPHILEHAVLCGSRRFPVKKPFLELLKGSLHTFLNAFTGLDRTTYPVASLNLRSFYNLADVYWDSVFHPLLTEETFLQEGWRLELEGESALSLQGVVFNEMKGSQSSAIGRLLRLSRSSLFSEHPYSHDAGGTPAEIPNLSFAALKAYHASHYHPSNAVIFFYGDDPPEARLEFAAERLAEYSYLSARTSRIEEHPLQSRQTCLEYPFTPMEGAADKGHVTCNWLLPRIVDRAERLRLSLLGQCLAGSSSAPLLRALIDSGLGSDVVGSGSFSSDLCQPVFTIGLEEVSPDNFEKVADIVDSTLGEISANGFDQDLVEAMLNTTEFAFREFGNQSFPRGLLLLMESSSDLLYGRRPYGGRQGTLDMFLALKPEIQRDSRCLSDLIGRYLSPEGHRSTVRLVPDPGHDESQRQLEQAKLASELETMTAADRQRLASRGRRLQQLQTTPDSPEDLATIPSLSRCDLEVDSPEYSCDEAEFDGVPVFRHDIDTKGIIYPRLLFDLHALPSRYLPCLEIFRTALLQTGTTKEDFAVFGRRIRRLTGGIHTSQMVLDRHDADEAAAYLALGGKCLKPQLADLAALLGEALQSSRLDNRTRIEQLVRQMHASMEDSLVPYGHSLAATRMAARDSEAAWLDEQTDGISYLLFLRDLAANFEEKWPCLSQSLEEMRSLLFQRSNVLIDVIGARDDREQWEQELPDLLAFLPGAPVEKQSWDRGDSPNREAFLLPSAVNYVGRSYDLRAAGFRHHGSASVISRHISMNLLWGQIREQGGAYGCSCTYNRHSGRLSFVSYRDPTVSRTLATYDLAADFLESGELDDSELDKLVIGTFGTLDRDLQPKAQGEVALQRVLTGSTSELRLRHRQEILDTGHGDLKRLARHLNASRDTSRTVVLGSEAAIRDAEQADAMTFDSELQL